MSDCMNIINEFDAHVALEDLTCNETCEDIVSLGEYIINEMSEFSNYCDDPYLMEATKTSTTSTQPEKKQNIFQKVLGYIKKFFAFLAKIFRWLINKVFKRKIKKTPDQVMEKLIGMNSTGLKNSTETGTKTGTGTKDDVEVVHFPSDPTSVIKETDIKVISKNLQIKVENNEYVMEPLEGFAGEDAKTATGAGKGGSSRHVTWAIQYMVDDHDFRTKLNDVIKKILLVGTSDVALEEVKLAWTKFDAIPIPNQPIRMKNSGDKLMEGYKAISEMTKVIENCEEHQSEPEYNELLSNIVSALTNITMGLNRMSKDFGYMYMIDKKYLHVISNPDQLAQFVNDIIEAGVGTQHVAYNCWCAMSKDFDDRGYFVYVDGNNEKLPRWGQSRVVFFPIKDNKSVLKVALNGTGILGNKTEIRRYKMYKKYNGENLLCEPLKAFYNDAIVSFERVETNSDNASAEVKNILNNDEQRRSLELAIQKLAKNYGLAPIGDLHSNNIGVNSNHKLVVIDYAL